MPGIGGRLASSGHDSSARRKVEVTVTVDLPAPLTPYSIVALLADGAGKATALAQVRVSAHQAKSSRKLLPRPLSPAARVFSPTATW